MNSQELKTLQALRSILNMAVEQSVRADRAGVSGDADRSAESFPLIDQATLEAMPPRARGPVNVAVRALAGLVHDGDSTQALGAVADAALRLVTANAPGGHSLSPPTPTRSCTANVPPCHHRMRDSRSRRPGRQSAGPMSRECPDCGRPLRPEWAEVCVGCSHVRRPAVIQTPCTQCRRPAVHSEGTPSVCHRCRRGEPATR